MAHPKHSRHDSPAAKKRLSERKRRGGLQTVLAVSSRQRLLNLSSVGIGRKAVAEFTGIDNRTLGRIKNGQTQYVRKGTAELIKSVPFNAFSDKAVIDGSETRRLLRRMTSERMGFTKAEIARRLGKKEKCPLLFIGRKKMVIAKSAMAIEKLYNIVTAGEVAA
jgi:hypothetical protein